MLLLLPPQVAITCVVWSLYVLIDRSGIRSGDDDDESIDEDDDDDDEDDDDDDDDYTSLPPGPLRRYSLENYSGHSGPSWWWWP